MKNLLPLLLILIVLLSCGRGGKASDTAPSLLVPDSFAIGLNLFNKGRAASHSSANMDSGLFYMQLAENFFIREGDKAQVNRFIAFIYSSRGMLDEAVPYFLKASRMADEWQYSSICQEVA